MKLVIALLAFFIASLGFCIGSAGDMKVSVITAPFMNFTSPTLNKTIQAGILPGSPFIPVEILKLLLH